MRVSLKFILVFITSLVLISCSFNKDKTDKSPIVIGEFTSMTGSEATFGKSTHKGILLAIEEQNAQGGVNGRPLKLVSKDAQGSIETTIKVVNELINKHKVVALIGEIASSRSLAAAPIAQKNNVPMISPASTNPSVTEVGDYIFRICYIDPFQGYVMAKFAANNLKIKKVAVFKDNESTYSKGLAEFFTKTFSEFGGSIVADEVYSSGDIDFKSQLLEIRAQKPDAIFIPGYYNDVALIARQIKNLGIKAHLLGGDGWDSQRLFEVGKDAVNGGYFSNHYTLGIQDKAAKDFRKKFQEKYKSIPDGLAAMGYDATNILIAALKKIKKTTGKELRNALAQTKNFPAVTGSITINKNRDAIKPVYIVRVDGPTNRYVTTIQPPGDSKKKTSTPE